MEIIVTNSSKFYAVAEDHIAAFDNDQVTIINLKDMVAIDPDSSYFVEQLEKLQQILPKCIIRKAGKSDEKLWDQMEKYFYSPNEVTAAGFWEGLKQFGSELPQILKESFDKAMEKPNQQLWDEVQNIDPAEYESLREIFESDMSDINELRKNLEKIKSKDLKNLILDELNLADSDIRVYKADLVDLILEGDKEDGPLDKAAIEKFDGADSSGLESYIGNWLKQKLGNNYEGVFVEPPTSGTRYVYIIVQGDSRVRAKWWPSDPINYGEYAELAAKSDDFASKVGID